MLDFHDYGRNFEMLKGFKLSNIMYLGRVYLGGYGQMHLYEDDKAQKWIFKPAQDKSGNIVEYRAFIQESGYALQKTVEPDAAVPVFAVNIAGKPGTLQPLIETQVSSDFFCQWQKDNSVKLDKKYLPQFLRENITDWLLANFDSYGGNFIVDRNNILLGIDKEQGFKYIDDEATFKLCYSYHPNKIFGALEPIYNTIYKRYISNEIDLDLNSVGKYIKKVEEITDDKYLKNFKLFAYYYNLNSAINKDILEVIISRKHRLRTVFSEFYGKVMSIKKGKDIKFSFNDDILR